MLKQIRQIFLRTDYKMLFYVLLLSIMGVFAIYSAGYDPSTKEVQLYYQKQIIWLVLGVIIFFITSFVNYSKLIRFSLIIYIFGILLLIAVDLSGYIGMGARRWIGIGSLKIQPSELFKIIWVITLAKIFIDFDSNSFNILKIIKKSILLIPPFFLVFIQPDLGTALTYFIVWSAIILILGVRRKTLFFIVLAVLIITPIGWNKLHDYQQDRITAFFNPEQDPFGSGYHVIQSKIAVGSGGLYGKGYLKGTQSHLRFIPERHTDFIYSVINEEFGIFGGTVILIMFLLLIGRILDTAIHHKEAGGKILALAVAVYIFFQFMINSYMTLGLMPVVGIPMPFVSYGGSSLLSFYAMLGIVNSIYIRRWRLNDI